MKTKNMLKLLHYLSANVSSNSVEAFKLLAMIMATDPNPIFIRELVDLNGTSAMRTGKLLDKLADDCLIQIIKSPEDGRKREITLTNYGRKLKEKIENEDYNSQYQF